MVGPGAFTDLIRDYEDASKAGWDVDSVVAHVGEIIDILDGLLYDPIFAETLVRAEGEERIREERYISAIRSSPRADFVDRIRVLLNGSRFPGSYTEQIVSEIDRAIDLEPSQWPDHEDLLKRMVEVSLALAELYNEDEVPERWTQLFTVLHRALGAAAVISMVRTGFAIALGLTSEPTLLTASLASVVLDRGLVEAHVLLGIED